MLGDKIGESRGEQTYTKIIDVGPYGPDAEIGAEEQATYLGVKGKQTVTFTSKFRPDGTLKGEGAGAFQSRQGDVAIFEGQGIGNIQEDGSVEFRGALFFQSQSKRLDKLNGIAVVYEYRSDPEENTEAEYWEWK